MVKDRLRCWPLRGRLCSHSRKQVTERLRKVSEEAPRKLAMPKSLVIIIAGRQVEATCELHSTECEREDVCGGQVARVANEELLREVPRVALRDVICAKNGALAKVPASTKKRGGKTTVSGLL